MAVYDVLARAILADGLIPQWQKQPSVWYLEGKIADESYFGGLTWYANRNFYLTDPIDFSSDTAQIQQAVQLIALGKSTTGRAKENIRQDEKDIEIQAQQQEFQSQLNEMNARVSAQLIALGQAQLDASSAIEANAISGGSPFDFLSGLGIGGLSGGLIIMAILLLVVAKK